MMCDKVYINKTSNVEKYQSHISLVISNRKLQLLPGNYDELNSTMEYNPIKTRKYSISFVNIGQ